MCGDPGRGQGLEAWKHPEFQWRFSMTKEGPYRKLTAKEKILDVIRHVEIYGRGREVNKRTKI